jgi:zinc and cadmium transporter
MTPLLPIIIATIVVSLASFVGILVVAKKAKSFLHYLIAFAAAALISVSLLDLIPEALETLEAAGTHAEDGLLFVIMGIVLFFLIERFIHWHHCGSEDCHDRPAGLLILTGDFVHNFIDGILIAGAFLLDINAGILTSLSILAHEIPQEIGDMSVLLHSGFSTRRALFLNFLSALSAVIGGVVGFFAFQALEGVLPYAVMVAAGGFLYIALSDIVPALHRHKKQKGMLFVETAIFILGIVFFWALLTFLGHAH